MPVETGKLRVPHAPVRFEYVLDDESHTVGVGDPADIIADLMEAVQSHGEKIARLEEALRDAEG